MSSQDFKSLIESGNVLVIDNQFFISKYGIEFPYYEKLIELESISHFILQEKDSYSHHFFFSKEHGFAFISKWRNDVLIQALSQLVNETEKYDIVAVREFDKGYRESREIYTGYNIDGKQALIYPRSSSYISQLEIEWTDTTTKVKKLQISLVSAFIHISDSLYNAKHVLTDTIKVSDEQDYHKNKTLNAIRGTEESRLKIDGKWGYFIAAAVIGFIIFMILFNIFSE